eukprot:6179648-Pleurochrysis_carterae.AAC.4
MLSIWMRRYATTQFWALPRTASQLAARTSSSSSSSLSSRTRSSMRPYLLVPLNEIVDEHYTVYFCRMSENERPPEYCL